MNCASFDIITGGRVGLSHMIPRILARIKVYLCVLPAASVQHLNHTVPHLPFLVFQEISHRLESIVRAERLSEAS